MARARTKATAAFHARARFTPPEASGPLRAALDTANAHSAAATRLHPRALELRDRVRRVGLQGVVQQRKARKVEALLKGRRVCRERRSERRAVRQGAVRERQGAQAGLGVA